MRSLARRYNLALLAFLLLALTWVPAMAATPGEITGIKLDADGQTLVIACKGTVGKPLARVIGKPNRLVIDFEGARMGKVPSKIKVRNGTVHELRVGKSQNRTRVVVDFQNRPVPAFTIKPYKKRIAVLFGKSLSNRRPNTADGKGQKVSRKAAETSPLSPSFVPAAANPRGGDVKALATALKGDRKRVKPADRSRSTSTPRHRQEVKVAQHSQAKRPGTAMPPARGTTTSKAVPGGLKTFPATSVPRRGAGRRMVREVRPPVTPPTPDPRLLVQAVTELRFIQVGHNSRLIIRGGDRLDYRLNKVSPTKVRIDLINAEIPKAHQKPLRTDLFSTSVEMIVPGSQTIFVQLKDAVPYQVEKKKGVLMVDFPPPRFALTSDQQAILQTRAGEPEGQKPYEARRDALLARRQAATIMREEEYRRKSEETQKQINLLIKEQEDILKERKEVERKYRLTPDPEIFNKPVTMDFQGISLRNAFRLLAEQAGLNIIVGNEVKGSTTMRLFQVPLGQVIDHILKTHNLDRDLVGNVMWIGSRKRIAGSKDQRMREYRRLLAQAQSRLKRNKKEIADLEKERERALRDLTKQQEAAEELPGELPSVEEVGATETIEIDGEPVTLLLVKVKLNYAKVADITPVLQCVFNRKCEGIPPSPGLVSRRVLAQAQRELTRQGFQPGSPGARARLRTVRRDQDVARRTRAAEIVAAEARVPEATGALRGATLDPRMSKILAHTVLWPNDKYNMLFIKDLPERIEEMKKLIYSLDVPTPQVLIESRLVQANRDWSRGLGILWGGAQNQTGLLAGPRQANWGVAGLQPGTAANTPTATATGFNLVNGTSIPSLLAVNLPAVVTGGAIMGLGMQFGLIAGEYATDLDLRLQLGEVQGKTKVIAQPKVQVLDGETATIKNGRQIAFLTVSADGTQTQLVDVDLLLDVEPTIYPDGRIEMELKVTDNDVGDPVNGVASILTREAKTIMIVKDGETAVIGGILRNTDSASRQGWPGLMNVPVLNMLFSNKTQRKFIEELLVFVTPTIIKRPPPAS
jgi:type IV pilus assembly protein PilQ